MQKPVLQTACAPVSPVEGSPPGFIGRGATVVTTNIVSGVVSGVATAAATSMPPPPPPSYAQSIQHKQQSQPGTPVPPSPVPTTPIPAANPPPSFNLPSANPPPSYNPVSSNPPSYNASIQAKQAAIQRALSPQAGELPPPPPYPSTAVSRPGNSGEEGGLVPATPVLARGSPVINTAKVRMGQFCLKSKVCFKIPIFVVETVPYFYLDQILKLFPIFFCLLFVKQNMDVH